MTLITVTVPRIVYKCKGRSGRGGACLPASSSACILPQPSTCSVISMQQITLRSHEVPQASLTHQASKPNFQGKLTLQKAGEKGTDLLNFPGLLSLPLPSGLRHKGRCQFVRLPQAIPDLLLPHNEKEAGCEKGF